MTKGDLLFEIDPRPFEAALAQAKGQLAQAQAQLGKAELDVKRYTPARQGQGDQPGGARRRRAGASGRRRPRSASAQAAVDQAQLNLDFTQIVSPVDGIAGLVQAQIGDLVGPGTGVLTTVSTVDPIKAYFPDQRAGLPRFRRQRARERAELPARISKFELILSDGTIYPQPGHVLRDRPPDRRQHRHAAGGRGLSQSGRRCSGPASTRRVRAVVRRSRRAPCSCPQRALTELQGGYQVADGGCRQPGPHLRR